MTKFIFLFFCKKQKIRTFQREFKSLEQMDSADLTRLRNNEALQAAHEPRLDGRQLDTVAAVTSGAEPIGQPIAFAPAFHSPAVLQRANCPRVAHRAAPC